MKHWPSNQRSAEEQGCPFLGRDATGCSAASRGTDAASRCHSDDHDRCASFLVRILLRTRLDVGRHDWCQAAK